MKTQAFYQDAITYNAKLANFATKLADEVNDPQVKTWARYVARQHREHATRHRAILKTLKQKKADSQQSVAEESSKDEGIALATNMEETV